MKEEQFGGPLGPALGVQVESLWRSHPSPKPFSIELHRDGSWASAGLDLDIFLNPICGWVTDIVEKEVDGIMVKWTYAEFWGHSKRRGNAGV